MIILIKSQEFAQNLYKKVVNNKSITSYYYWAHLPLSLKLNLRDSYAERSENLGYYSRDIVEISKLVREIHIFKLWNSCNRLKKNNFLLARSASPLIRILFPIIKAQLHPFYGSLQSWKLTSCRGLRKMLEWRISLLFLVSHKQRCGFEIEEICHNFGLDTVAD